MLLREIVEVFNNYFIKNNHKLLKSAPIVTKDPTLLFINAGMVPFKGNFLLSDCKDKNIVTSQRCIRTIDIDQVGITDRHATFFTMNGNFSFGGYDRKEAIEHAYNLLINEFHLDKEKLFITYHKLDYETYDIWSSLGIGKNKLIAGEDDNLWFLPNGPIGYCTEIFYDRGIKYGNDNFASSEARYLEIWNLVFPDKLCDAQGNIIDKLNNINVDTGMGVERMALVLNDVDSIYDFGVLLDIKKYIVNNYINLKKNNNNKVNIQKLLRIITDHIVASTILIDENIVPSNALHGYVLRKLIRRLLVSCNILDIKYQESKDIIIYAVHAIVSDKYYNINLQEDNITNIIFNELDTFNKSLDYAYKKLDDIIKKTNYITAEQAFKLHDTYGLHIDILKAIADINSITIDIEGYYKLMKIHKEKSKNKLFKQQFLSLNSEFIGYELDTSYAKVLAIVDKDNNKIDSIYNEKNNKDNQIYGIIFDKTPFYAESGGQLSDTGLISIDEDTLFKVYNVQKHSGAIIHYGQLVSGNIVVGDSCYLQIDNNRRNNLSMSHSATHLLNRTIRDILPNTSQAGSENDVQKLRFDYFVDKPLQDEQLLYIEKTINDKLRIGLDVSIKEIDIDKAKNSDIIFNPDTHYSNKVRVVNIGDYSKELCGGTHVTNSYKINSFVLKSDSSIGAGKRRIEGFVGNKAAEFIQNKLNILNEIDKLIKSSNNDNLLYHIKQLLNKVSLLEGLVKRYNCLEIDNFINKLFDNHSREAKNRVIYCTINGTLLINKYSLKYLIAQLSIKFKVVDVIIILYGRYINNDIIYIIMNKLHDTNNNNVNIHHIFDIIKQYCNCKGGGTDRLIQATGGNLDKIDIAIKEINRLF